MSTQTIQNGSVALIHYTLTNDAGEVIDTSQGRPPLPYLHGAGNIVPGLEKGLEGLSVGDIKKVDVAPGEGYGERQGEGPQEVARSQFPEGAHLEAGMGFQAQGEDGQMMILYITKVEGQVVWVDINHPLAGETLHFEVEVAGIRSATDEELAHGHPHGLEGTEGHGHDDDGCCGGEGHDHGHDHGKDDGCCGGGHCS